MPRKKWPPSAPGPGQLSLFGETALPKEPASLPAPASPPEPKPEPEALEPTELEPPFVSRAQRETTAFQVYQASMRETRNLVMVTLFLAFLLQGLRSGSAAVGKLSFLGLELSVADRSNLIGLVGFAALFISVWASWSMFTTQALWRKCGLFYQEIVRPSDNILVRSLRGTTIYGGTLLLGLAMVHSVHFAHPHMLYFAVGIYDPRAQIPEKWNLEMMQECPGQAPPGGSRSGPERPAR